MPQIVKIGEKGRHVQIPDGWYQVKCCFPIKKDMFCNVQTLRFQEIEEEDLMMHCSEFDLLIRKDPGCDYDGSVSKYKGVK